VTKNIAKEFEGLSSSEIEDLLDDLIEELEWDLENLPTKYADTDFHFDKPHLAEYRFPERY
jgi:hypothetical protein